jgi:hypothetical protein
VDQNPHQSPLRALIHNKTAKTASSLLVFILSDIREARKRYPNSQKKLLSDSDLTFKKVEKIFNLSKKMLYTVPY